MNSSTNNGVNEMKDTDTDEFIEVDETNINEIFEKVTNRFQKKRISREIKELIQSKTNNNINENHLSISMKIIEKTQTNIIRFKDHLYKTHNEYTFTLKYGYPFSPPILAIQSIPYSTFLSISSIQTMNILKELQNIDCLCCHSIVLCDKLWKTSYKMIDIIKEIRRFRKYRRDILNKIFINKIKERYSRLDDIDLLGWL